MKVLVVRVNKASVVVGGEEVSSIARGLAVFAGIEKDDDDSTLVEMAQKIVDLRIFENEKGKLSYSLADKKLELLCVSNFTLCADCGRGRRPSFDAAMPAAAANEAFDKFIMLLAAKDLKVKRGSFGRHMDISLEMDGPVNIWLDNKYCRGGRSAAPTI